VAVSPFFLVVIVAMLAERGVEILLDRRNTRRLEARGARWLGRHDGLALLVVAQVVLFAGTVGEVTFAPWGGEHALSWALVIMLVLAQVLRYWAIATLGERWSIRVVTVPDEPRLRGGPYRWFSHPNYGAVLVEAVVLPLAFGAYATAAVAGVVQGVALWVRIRIEEGALDDADVRAPR
jgi:methyltransferase